MTSKKTEAERYVSGDAPLPPTFTTGFKRDLEVAHEMVKLRQKDTADRVTEIPESATLSAARRDKQQEKCFDESNIARTR